MTRVQLFPDVREGGGDDDHFITVFTVYFSVRSSLLLVILVCLTGKLNFVSDILVQKEHRISELAVYTQCTLCVERPGAASAGQCVHAQVCLPVRACVCLDHSEKVNTNIFFL